MGPERSRINRGRPEGRGPWQGRSTATIAVAFVVAVTGIWARGGVQAPATFDVLIAGGRVMDGTGNPWFYADVGIRNGRIAAVGALADRSTAARTIDAAGLTVVPGFIDLHSHAYDEFRPGDTGPVGREGDERRAAPNLVAQGVTTVVTNQDGRSGWPIAAQRQLLSSGGIGTNAILLVGHGTIRGQVLGSDYKRVATPAEVSRMAALVTQGMQEGAFGVSAGLEYVPGRWSDTDEMVGVVAPVAPYRGVFIEHERASGADPMWYLPSQDPPGPPTILDSVAETIQIAERSRVTSVVSHIKSKGQKFWGVGRAAVNLIETARARGVDVWADNYPYNTSGTDGSTTLIPEWASGADPKTALKEVMNDPRKAAALRGDVAYEINRRGGASNLVVMDFPDKALVGQSLAAIATTWKVSDVDAALGLAAEGFNRRGGARIRGFSLSELDIETFSAQKWVATASDAGVALPGDPFTHARFYGTFPRKIRHYAIERGVLSVEDAVRSMTSLPAQVLRLKDRGQVREGFVADLAIVDFSKVRDTSTFFEPHHYAEGIPFVLVNGTPVVDRGVLTWARPGKVLPIQER